MELTEGADVLCLVILSEGSWLLSSREFAENCCKAAAMDYLRSAGLQDRVLQRSLWAGITAATPGSPRIGEDLHPCT